MRGQYPVSLACEVLEVSASGYFNCVGADSNLTRRAD